MMVAHKGGETPCDRLVDIEARLEDSVGHVYVIVHGSAFDGSLTPRRSFCSHLTVI